MTDKKCAVYGLIGFPVKHSFSAAMHNAAFRARRINAEYKLFEVKPEELKDFLLKRKDIKGFNITIPHKVEALLLIKEFTRPVASAFNIGLIGAINTVKRQNNKLLYRNTDWEGFRRSLVEDLKFDPQGKNVLMLGCGGAGRAVMAGLAIKPKIKTLYIYEVNPAVVKSAKEHFANYRQELGYEYRFISKEEQAKVIKNCHLLVNASPLGLKEKDISPIDKNLLHKNLSVYDLVYNRKSELTQNAEKICRAAKGGLGMLLYQGAAAFKFWTGKSAPLEVMRQALNSEVKKLS